MMSVRKAHGWLILVLTVVAIYPSLPLPIRLIQTNMPLHMLVQLPALLILGFLLNHYLTSKWLETSSLSIQVAKWLWTYFSIFFWILPINVDHVLQYAHWDWLKLLSLVLAGYLLKGFLQSNNVIKLFFMGGLSMMLLFMGIFYQETELRLCSGYLQDAQQTTGFGLMLFGFATLFFLITQFERSK